MPDVPRSAGRLLWRAIHRHRGSLVGGYSLIALWQLCEALVPVMIGVIIDRGVATRDPVAFTGWCLGLCALMTVLSLSYRFGGRLGFAAVQDESHLLRVETAGHVLHPRGARTGMLPGETLSLATSDAQMIGGVVRQLGFAIAAALSVTVAAVYLVQVHLATGLLILLGVPAVLIVTQVVTPLIARRTAAQQVSIARASGIATDFVQGLRPLKGCHGEDVAIARYRAVSQQAKDSSIRTARSYGYLFGLTSGLSGLLLAAVTVVAGRQALEGEISLGELVAIMGLTQFLAEPIAALGELSAEAASSWASSRRIVEFLHTPRLAGLGHREPPPGRGRLIFDGIAVGPLHGLTFATCGELVALAIDDPSGSDALVALLRGEVTAESGSVCLDGVDLEALTVDGRRDAVLVSEHHVDLFEGTLRSNIDPEGRLADGPLADVLAASAAADVVALHTDGLDHGVTARGLTMSGGQRQRIALARALATEAPILVLHDPSSAVDSVTERDIALGLRRLRHAAGSDLTTIVVTSSPALLDQADRVLFFSGGTIVARGTHHELLADPEYRAAVLR